jgi:GNAT superfamily N-acetyltransferase
LRILDAVHRADAYPTHWPEDPQSWLTPSGLLGAWVAEVDNLIAGHVALRAGARPAEITRLFVAGESRGRGVGRALLEIALREAAVRGLKPEIEVVETNRAAIALYERAGWRRISSEPWVDAADGRTLLHRYTAPEPGLAGCAEPGS